MFCENQRQAMMFLCTTVVFLLILRVIQAVPDKFATEETTKSFRKQVSREVLSGAIRSQWIKELKDDLLKKLSYSKSLSTTSLSQFNISDNTLGIRRVIHLQSWYHCQEMGRESLCLNYDSLKEIDDEHAWKLFFRMSGKNDANHTQRFLLKECEGHDDFNCKAISEISARSSFSEWISMDISVTQSTRYQRSNPILVLQELDTNSSMIESSFQSFIAVTNHQKKRHKRSLDLCQPTRRNCCKESMYVSFRELGWDRWIIEPKGFTMYFCAGPCDRFVREDIERAGNTYVGLLMEISPPQRLVMDHKRQLPNLLKQKIMPCCIAKRKASFNVLLAEFGGYNNIRLASLTDFIVEECGCVG